MPGDVAAAAEAPAATPTLFPRDMGLRVLDPGEDPVPQVKREGLRLLDVRRPDIDEVADAAKQKRVQAIARRYNRAVDLRNDILFAGEGLQLFRGHVCRGDHVVEGTFYRKKRDAVPPEDSAQRARLAKTGRFDALQGVNAHFQKPGTNNYFHWMIECLPRLEVLRPLVLAGEVDGLILHFGKVPRFVEDSVQHLYPDMVPYLRFVKKLTIADELAFFISGDAPAGQRSVTRMSTATNRFLEALPRADAPGEDVIVVSRRDMDNRRLLNEDDLVAFLEQRFRVVRLVGSRMTIAEQQEVFGRARAIVGVHGAGLSNLIFAPRGCRLIEITTVQYIKRTASFHDASVLAGGEPHLVLAEEVGDRPVIVDNLGNDMFIDPAQFARVAELI